MDLIDIVKLRVVFEWNVHFSWLAQEKAKEY